METGQPIERRQNRLAIGYVLWIFGFLGAHRFYYGRPKTGTLWFFTGGLLGIGWLIDAFLIPEMDRVANLRYPPGRKDPEAAWLLLVFTGWLGLHRFYLEKWISGLVYFLTGGLFGIGYLYDLWTLNEQIVEANTTIPPRAL